VEREPNEAKDSNTWSILRLPKRRTAKTDHKRASAERSASEKAAAHDINS
jgi:hypothetical protein